MKKSKKYVMMVASNFFVDHPKAGQPTNFAESIEKGEKKHTIRQNYAYWQHVVNEVNSGRATLDLRTWEGKPYRSKQKTLKTYEKLGIQECAVDMEIQVVYILYSHEAKNVEKNDGLSIEDFWNWFRGKNYAYHGFKGCIVHFTEFRY